MPAADGGGGAAGQPVEPAVISDAAAAKDESQRYDSHVRVYAALMAASQMTPEEVLELVLSDGKKFPAPARMAAIMEHMPLNLRELPRPAQQEGTVPQFKPITKADALSAGDTLADAKKRHRNSCLVGQRALANLVQTTSTKAKPSLEKGYKMPAREDALDTMLTVLRGGIGRAGVEKQEGGEGDAEHGVWRATYAVDHYEKRSKKQSAVVPFVKVAAADIEGPPVKGEYQRSQVQHKVRNFVGLEEAAEVSERFKAAYESLGVDERAAWEMLRIRDPKIWRPVFGVRKQRDEPAAQECAQEILGGPPRKFPRFLLQNTDIMWQGLNGAQVYWDAGLLEHTVWSDAGTIDVAKMIQKLHGIGFKGDPVPSLVRSSYTWTT